MKRKLSLILVSVMIFTLLTGCGNDNAGNNSAVAPETEEVTQAPEETETADETADSVSGELTDADGNKPLLGYVCFALEAEYFQTNSYYLEKICEKEGWDYVVQGGDYTNPSSQADIIENFITMGVDAIVLNPISADACLDAIKQAEDAGVIVVGQGITEADEAFRYCSLTISSDVYGDGRRMTELAIEQARQNLSDEEIKVCVLSTRNGETNVIRSNGMEDAVKEILGEDALVATAYPNDTEEAMSAAEDAQSANNGEINTWVCFNDNFSLGVYQYYLSSNLDQSNVTIVGYDGIASALDLIKSGDNAVKGTLGNAYISVNQNIVDAVTIVLQDGDIEEAKQICKDVVFVESITHENVEAYIAEANREADVK